MKRSIASSLKVMSEIYFFLMQYLLWRENCWYLWPSLENTGKSQCHVSRVVRSNVRERKELWAGQEMPRMEKRRVVRWCPRGPNRTPDSLPSSQGPDHAAWMWPMAMPLKHPFKMHVCRLIAMDRQNQGMCLIFRNIFKKRVWFTRAEVLVFGALLASSLSS